MFFRTTSWVMLFFNALTKEWIEVKLKKIAFYSSLSLAHFSLSAMYEVVGEAVLPNSFFKTAKLHRESCS